MKVAGVWRYVYRAVDEHGQILDIFVSIRRDDAAAEWFFAKALRDHGEPLEVVTDKSPVLARVIADLVPDAEHCTDQYANNRVECDHGRLKARLRPMRGLKHDRTASVVMRGHALVQNLRRGHYQLASHTDRSPDSKQRSASSSRPSDPAPTCALGTTATRLPTTQQLAHGGVVRPRWSCWSGPALSWFDPQRNGPFGCLRTDLSTELRGWTPHRPVGRSDLIAPLCQGGECQMNGGTGVV